MNTTSKHIAEHYTWGEGLHVAPGEMHRVVNAAETPAQFLVISAPPSHGDRILAQMKGTTP